MKKKKKKKSCSFELWLYLVHYTLRKSNTKFGRKRGREKKTVTHLYSRMLHRHIYTCRGFCEIIYNADGVESVTVISVHRKPENFPVGGNWKVSEWMKKV